MTSETGRSKKTEARPSFAGFTLLEILIAFAILLTGLTLILGLFSRHLGVLRLLSGTVTASHAADERLIHEALNREDGLTVPPSSEGGFTTTTRIDSIHFDQNPLKDLAMDQVTAEISWEVRNQIRSTQMKAGFQPKK